jgi:hypothetical protein
MLGVMAKSDVKGKVCVGVYVVRGFKLEGASVMKKLSGGVRLP